MRKEDIMDLGEKIANLRKESKLSQEELAEKIGVARQTISKWELNETAPDIKQAKELSHIFNVSLDELVGNDISNVVVEKISNTEKLAGIIIKILKVAGIILVAMVVIDLIVLISAVLFFRPNSSKVDTWSSGELTCSVDDEKYLIKIEKNGLFSCQNCDKELSDNLELLIDYNNYTETKNNIVEYFENAGIKCELKEY